MPPRRRAYGPRLIDMQSMLVSPSFPYIPIHPLPPRVWLDKADPTVVHFSTFDLRPETTVRLEPLTLVGTAELAGCEVRVASATATNVNGRIGGEFSLAFSSTSVAAREFLEAASPDPADDPEDGE